uniref:DUF1308 domain-containing protein n=1 Tax=Pyricularia oryzae (strain P131) TaxID=1143193 RepID=L7J8D3_PYRO1
MAATPNNNDAIILEFEDMRRRSDILLDELQKLEELGNPNSRDLILPGQLQNGWLTVPGIRPMVNRVKSETLSLERALEDYKKRLSSDSEDDLELARKRLRSRLVSCNLPSAEAQWDVIKRCSDLRAVGQQFSRTMALTHGGKPRPQSLNDQKRESRKPVPPGQLALVDAIVDGGAEWIRVMSITESRLLEEMAAGGWDWGCEDSDDEDQDTSGATGTGGNDDGDDDDEMEISIVKTVKGLVQAAEIHQATSPGASATGSGETRIHVMLTRIREGSQPEIDRLLRHARRMGRGNIKVIIDGTESGICSEPIPPLETALQNLVPYSGSPEKYLTEKINLDASTMIALISDISHAQIEVQDWHRKDIQKQIQEEDSGSNATVAKFLYPLLVDRELVCTLGAAQRVWDIVSMMGTGGEPSRTALLIPRPGQDLELTEEESLKKFREHCVHPVPDGLRLPIKIIDAKMAGRWEGLVEEKKLPEVVRSIAKDLLNEVNMESFLYGWEAGITTVTANGSLAQQIGRALEEDQTQRRQTQQGEEGSNPPPPAPLILVHSVRRSLGAKGQPRERRKTNGRAKE